MQKRNHALGGLSPVTIEENRRSVCITARSHRREVELSVSSGGLVLKAGTTIRLAPDEVAAIRLNKVKPPMWPYITGAVAVAAAAIPFVPGVVASWIILALGLLLAVVRHTRDERLSIEIETVWGSRITIGFRRGSIDENKLCRTISSMCGLLRGKKRKNGHEISRRHPDFPVPYPPTLS